MKTYQETIDWMFNQLPMYQNQGATAYKKDLTNTILLSNYLGNPHHDLKCIHVGGTNGKGSTSHLLASVLQQAGYKVGLYTSPHLKDYRERIKINGKEIDENFVVEFINEHQSFFEQHQLSFFEMTVGLAFSYFKKEKTDINIIEVGMGGRLDSTNIIQPLVSVITNIGLDHTQFLGSTLKDIATEKAGIIKNNIPVVIGEYTKETKVVFEEIAKRKNAEIYFASDIIENTFPSQLLGQYQEHNKKTVLQTLHILRKQESFKFTDEHIAQGFLKVVDHTGLLGRWQTLQQNPTVICDTAHNAHGLTIVMKQLLSQNFERLHFVLGVVNDKKLDDVLPLLPKNAKYYFCKPNIPRGLDENILAIEAKKINLIGETFNSVSEAYQDALANCNEKDLVYIGGSTFVVAEIL